MVIYEGKANGQRSWILDLGIVQGLDGKFRRKRIYCPTKAAAEEEKRKRKELAAKSVAAASNLSSDDTQDAVSALTLLRPYGKTLLEAARFLLDNCQVQHPETNVREAVRAYLLHFQVQDPTLYDLLPGAIPSPRRGEGWVGRYKLVDAADGSGTKEQVPLTKAMWESLAKKETYYMTLRARLWRISEQTREKHRRDLEVAKAAGAKASSVTKLSVPFAEAFGDRPLIEAVLQKKEIAAWLKENYPDPVTRNLVKGQLSTAFGWWQVEGYISRTAPNTFNEIDRVEQPAKAPGIYKPHQVRSLLYAAAYGVEDKETGELVKDEAGNVITFPDLVPWIAIATFSGVRREELKKLDSAYVRPPDLVHVPGDVAKMGMARDVPIHPTLLAWLVAFPPQPGALWPVNGRRKLDRLRELTGVDTELNGFRHSFGSYRYAVTRNKELVAHEMRHEDVKTFDRHYNNQGITTAEAIEFWQIVPRGVTPPEIVPAKY